MYCGLVTVLSTHTIYDWMRLEMGRFWQLCQKIAFSISYSAHIHFLFAMYRVHLDEMGETCSIHVHVQDGNCMQYFRSKTLKSRRYLEYLDVDMRI
jgi:hypothetical protein